MSAVAEDLHTTVNIYVQPPFEYRGMDIHMRVIQRPTGEFDFDFRILVGRHTIPGGFETPGSLTALDAAGRCLTMAQQRIDYFLSQAGLEYWANHAPYSTEAA
jgi:hypothetical protein